MPIKIGFSTSVCPNWDIHDIAEQANEMGFYGIELGVVNGELHLPEAPDLQADKDIDAVRKLFEERNVEIASLSSRYALDPRPEHLANHMSRRTIENIELAGKLGCPRVRVPLGKPTDGEPIEPVLARQIPRFQAIAGMAVENGVTLMVGNTPWLPSSRHVWTVVDGVSHPGVRASWDPVIGMSSRETDTSTLAIKRISARLAQVQVNDAEFDADGRFLGYRAVGQGSVDFERTVNLLKGILFDGYLMIDWPKVLVDDLPDPGQALPEALSFLVNAVQHIDPLLTAYAKDKNKPNYATATPSFVKREVGGAVEEESEAATASEDADKDGGEGKVNVPKGGDPKIAAMVAEAVRKVRAARAAKGG